MLNKGVTNILTENVLTSFSKALDPTSHMKIICLGNFDPLSRKSCEVIATAHETVHRFQFTRQSRPTLIVPLLRKNFNNNIVWESSMCGLSNHKLVDYVVDVERCSMLDIIDRLKPDFIFSDRNMLHIEEVEVFAKRLRIKFMRV